MGSNKFKRAYGVDSHGRLIPKPLRVGGKRKRQGVLNDPAVRNPIVVRWPVDQEKLVGVFLNADRETELEAIDQFATNVGITYLPPGASYGSYNDLNPLEEVDVFEHESIKVKNFEMISAGPGGVTFRRRVMVSEGMFCPVCEEYYKVKPKKCKVCGHLMKKKKATAKEMIKWRKTLEHLPVRHRTYKGFTYEDYDKFGANASAHNYTHDELVDAYLRLFPKLPIKGGPIWLQLMVGYELQRRIAYPNGEPDKVKKIRLDLRKGKLPEWAIVQEEHRMKEKEKRKMAKKKSGKGKSDKKGRKTRIEVFGNPVTAVLRAMGNMGYTGPECYAFMQKKKVKVRPTTCGINTSERVRTELWNAKLTPAQKSEIKKFMDSYRKKHGKPKKKKATAKKEPAAKKKAPPKKKKVPPKKKKKATKKKKK